MNIVVIFTTPFPYADAGANRVISYAKEIAAMGHTVTVHSLQPSVRPSQLDDPNIPKPVVEGVIDGINYIHTAGTVLWPESGKGLLKKRFLRIKARLKSIRLLIKERKRIDILQIYSHSTSDHNLYGFFSHRLHIPYVAEFSEYPIEYKQRDIYNKTESGRRRIRKVERSFKSFDAWILETQNLVDYYIPFARPDAKYCIVPMTVEDSRFVGYPKSESRFGHYIGYCGNMREGDGISILIKAFASISAKYPDYKLVLAGDSIDVPSQKELVNKIGLDDRVLFIGRLSRNEIPEFITIADVLCLASPKSDRASATMPCKVGEYLCTGNPVVVTGQGELFKYLTDGVNAYLPEPDSIESFANKLDYVLSYPVEAAKVGKQGITTAIREFGSEAQAKRIIDFFESVIKV